METSTVNTLATIGKAVNVAAGHVGEMAGSAMSAAGKATGCPVAETAGKAVQAAGKAWADTAVSVANRDRGRLTK
jgi:uncharacterized protein YjbJ (UPF0337 family)